MRTGSAVLAAALACTLMIQGSAQAQPFGQSKVQYKDLTFEVLKTEHFDIYFYAEERGATSEVARMAERWYSRFSEVLGHRLRHRQPIVLYASHPDFEQTNVVGGAIGEGTGGVTEGLKRRVVLPLAGTLAETDHVLGHELVHAFQYDMAQRTSEQPGSSALDRLPLWFIEGMAEYLSLGPVDPHTAMWIRDAARNSKLPEIGKLDDARLFPYRWGQALWAYLGGRWGDEVVGTLYDEALKSGDVRVALDKVLRVKEKDLSREWHEAIHAQYDPVLRAGRRAGSYGTTLTAQKEQQERGINVSPSLSPDGTRVVYLSARGLLSVDLYLADAQMGRIIRRLVNTAIDPHFTSLQSIASAGSWHPNGRLFVFGAVHGGRPELAVLDVDTGRTVREVPFPDLGEILNPSWSPDGRFIAFSGTRGGYSDLFIYDLDRAAFRQVTHDAFADLQPAWAPDGSRLAFVTDRFSTNLAMLHAGAYGLALLDPATERIEPLPTFDRGKSINPQWAPDARNLYFLSDRTGLTNIYTVNVFTREVRQVTNLDAGVSGITALSPALSSPLDAQRIAFSAYNYGQFGIYTIDDPESLRGSPVVAPWFTTSAAALPPETRLSATLTNLLADPAAGLLPGATGSVEAYRPRLSLDFIGQPYVSVGVDRFGTSYGGGLSFLWSDMLGNHSLMATVDANTYGSGVSGLFKNTGGILAYQNLTRRWNWGVAIQQTPYLAGGVNAGIITSGGQLAYVEQTITERQIYRGTNGVVAYPFNRAHRVEFGAGYNHVSYEQEVRTILTSLQTGREISDQTESSALADPLNLGSISAALVSDTSVFGATSPVAGRRSRLELSPTFGSIAMTTATVDYRRYFMPVSFYTFAARILHVGRYGAGAEDPRLLPLFIGYPELVRGYEIGSFVAADCTVGAISSCQEFDRLQGSRVLVGNLEFRFPLLRPFGVRSGMYGPLPTEVALFTDGGVAWNQRERPWMVGGDRRPVYSSGVALRTNLFNFAIAQVALAHPFQRLGRGWTWTFTLAPGF